MFATFDNSVSIAFTLKPDGPVLVRAQSVGADPGLADMEFHRTRRDGRSTVFLAGSGLKGVIRAHCERLLRTHDHFACDPTKVSDRTTCGSGKPDDARRRDPRDYPHAGQCPACFTFGSLKLAGRFRVEDAFPVEALWEETNRTEVRTGVGIDRKSQGSSLGALYDTEVVVGGGFSVRIGGENFTLWQLGLVLEALEHLQAGYFRIGGGKARGMGKVTLEDVSIDVRMLGAGGSLHGVKDRTPRRDYGLRAEAPLPVEAPAVESQEGLFRTLHYPSEAVPDLRHALVDGALADYLARKV